MSEDNFTRLDQERFSDLSGDRNPLHLDVLAARRLIFGGTVVHGIHTLLRGLEKCFRGRSQHLKLHTLKADFRAPLRVGDPVEWKQSGCGEGAIEMSCRSRGQVRSLIEATFTSASGERFGEVQTKAARIVQCRDLSGQDLAAVSGETDLYLDGQLSSILFPTLSKILPPVQLAAIIACSRIVGMQCPGLHSLFSSVDLSFSTGGKTPDKLFFGVDRYDKRFSRCAIKIHNEEIVGVLTAFVRPAPKKQPGFNELAELVIPGEFAGQRALIVGGSRGLGELTAKLLCAGGAQAGLTYHTGAEDAERVAAEISEGGGKAQALQFDVTSPPEDLYGELGWNSPLTHLYYFATPAIFVAAKKVFSVELFEKFCQYYVASFLATFEAANSLALNGLKVLYPSTIAIEQPVADMAEYAAAKAAGESLCTWLEKTWPGTIIFKPRLPRLETDQTASLLSLRTSDTKQVMLESIRRLRDI